MISFAAASGILQEPSLPASSHSRFQKWLQRPPAARKSALAGIVSDPGLSASCSHGAILVSGRILRWLNAPHGLAKKMRYREQGAICKSQNSWYLIFRPLEAWLPGHFSQDAREVPGDVNAKRAASSSAIDAGIPFLFFGTHEYHRAWNSLAT